MITFKNNFFIMQTTSHFIGIELKTNLFSDIFVKVYNYLKENQVIL